MPAPGDLPRSRPGTIRPRDAVPGTHEVSRNGKRPVQQTSVLPLQAVKAIDWNRPEQQVPVLVMLLDAGPGDPCLIAGGHSSLPQLCWRVPGGCLNRAWRGHETAQRAS